MDTTVSFTKPEAMWEELEADRRQSEKMLKVRDKMVARYHGPYYDPGNKDAEMEPENPAYEWISTIKSQILAGVPGCTLKPTRADKPIYAMKAKALRYATNRVSRERDDRSTYGKLFIDWCFGPCYATTVRQPAPWLDAGPVDGPVHRPAFKRISPRLFRKDARATDWADTRWRGSAAITNKPAALRMAKTGPGWDVAAINRIKTDTNLDREISKEGMSLQGRDDFKLWRIWVPEEQLHPDFDYDNGFWGTVHYYAESGKDNGNKESMLVEIRKPQPYFGCRRGPFHMSGQMYVPDRIAPLSVMTAIESIARALRLSSVVMNDAIATYKRFILEGTGTKNLGMLLKNARHNGVYKAKGFQKGMAEQFTVGGPDPTMLAAYEFLQQQLDKRWGLSQSNRGNTQPGVTATAETYAAIGGSSRVALLRDEFYAFVADGFRATAEMIDQDEQFFMPAPPELAGQIPFIVGGREPGESFDDYELQVEPLSMRYRSEEERAAAADYEIALFERIGAIATQFPFIDCQGILLDVAEARGESQLPSRYDAQLAASVASLMLMQAIPPEEMGQPGEVRPQGSMTNDLPAGRVALQRPPQAGGTGGTRGATPSQPLGGGGAQTSRSRGASAGNKSRKASFAAQGGRPRGS